MSIDFAIIMPALKTWFTDSTGLQCRLKNEADGFKNTTHGILEVRGVRGVHVDDQRSTFAAGALSYDIEGNRTLTLEVRVRSRSQEPRDNAWTPIERARSQMRAPWTKARFADVGIALVDVGDTTVFDAPWQDRVESIAVFEARLAVVAHLDDKRSNAGVIDEVELSSNTLDNAGGAPLDSALQLDQEIIP